MRPHLYLEQRIAIARRALNEKTIHFGYALPPEQQLNFKQFILDVMSVLDGFDDGARNRLKNCQCHRCNGSPADDKEKA